MCFPSVTRSLAYTAPVPRCRAWNIAHWSDRVPRLASAAFDVWKGIAADLAGVGGKRSPALNTTLGGSGAAPGGSSSAGRMRRMGYKRS